MHNIRFNGMFIQLTEYRIIYRKLFINEPQKPSGAPDIFDYKESELSGQNNNFFGDHFKEIISSQSHRYKVNPAVHIYKFIQSNITNIRVVSLITKNAKPVVYY